MSQKVLISQIYACSSGSCVVEVRVPGGQHVFGLVTGQQLYKEVVAPASHKRQPALLSSRKPESHEEGQEVSGRQLAVRVGTRVRQPPREVLFLVAPRNCDITGKGKGGRFGQYQDGILPHPNFAIGPFMRFMTEKGQIVSKNS